MSAAVRIHSLDHARAALSAAAELRVPVTLVSGPGAGAYAGPAWFEQIVAQAAAEFPSVRASAILDCGDSAGAAMAAIRLLAEPGRQKVTLCIAGDAERARRLAEMAEAAGIATCAVLPRSLLDLRGVDDSPVACRDFLSR